MYKCQLQIKVCNAADRSLDRHYIRDVELLLPPLPDTIIIVSVNKINTKIKSKEFIVRTYKQTTTSDIDAVCVFVRLEPDNTTFKQQNQFGSVCARLEELEFCQEPSLAKRKIKEKQ